MKKVLIVLCAVLAFMTSGCAGWSYGSVAVVSARNQHLGFAVAVCQAQSARMEQKSAHAYLLEKRAWTFVSDKKSENHHWINAYEKGIELGRQLSYRQALVECENRLPGTMIP